MKQNEPNMYQNSKVRSKLKIAYTLLLKEKAYTDITVTDVVSKADVARASFYRNYSSTIDIFDEIISKFTDSLVNDLLTRYLVEPEVVAREIIKKVIAISKTNAVDNILAPINGAYFRDKVISETVRKSPTGNYPLKIKYNSDIGLGIIFVGCLAWVEHGMKESEQEIEDYLFNVLKKSEII